MTSKEKYNKYYWKQWKQPFRLMYKGWGFSMWKWSGILFPTWHLWFGKGLNNIGFDTFHNGYGFSIHLHPIIIIDLCIKGKISWAYKKGLLRIRINKLEYRY